MGPGFWPVTIGMTVLNVILTYFIVTFPIDKYLPEAAKPAGDIDALFVFMAVIGNAIFVYVVGYVIYFCIVWRRRPEHAPDAIGIQIHDDKRLEFWWTLIPSLLVISIAIFSVRIWSNLQTTQGDVLTMEAIGHQFKFEFRYPHMKNSVFDDMHVPVDTPVTLHVTSVDVLHSFWVPEVRIKADMVPGLVQTLRFTPTRVGKYRIICTEFCGAAHGDMLAQFHIDSQADFAKWLALKSKGEGAGAGPLKLSAGVAERGRSLFGQKCATCHSVGPFDQKIVGPGLGKLAGDTANPKLVTGKPPTAQNIADILDKGYDGPDLSSGKEQPKVGVMPNRQANALSGQDIGNLTAYLLSLSKK